ncbi:hypothetical protein A3850_002490 [Lewinella sp. 4G2]|nr:hypothetical protein A3850_002490 [Lewinella sp. 4G2]
MFLKLDTYFLPQDKLVSLELFNGTFEESENVITRDRMQDVSILGNGKRRTVDTSQWSEVGMATVLTFKTGAPGTYVAGVSTRARSIEMDAEAFNGYLEHDGILDLLAERKADPARHTDAVERYSKHVKTIFQVGDKLTDDWATPLGYPIEFVPQSNPYSLKPGDEMQVQLLFDGAPLGDQLVYLGNDHAHGHAHTDAHEHEHAEDGGHSHAGIEQMRTDANGMITAKLPSEGVWYLRTINLVPINEPGLTHESNWATLTFELGHGHAHGAHTDHGHSHGTEAEHTHDHGHQHAHDQGEGHDHEAGLPGWVFWIASLVFVGVLFFYFNGKANARENY